MESVQELNPIIVSHTETKEHMGRFAFLKESIKNFRTVGTITRSSRYLSKAVAKKAQLNNAKVIVELGAGDGVMTRHILDSMDEDAVLFSFEVNPKFCKVLKRINDPRLQVMNISAEKLAEVLLKFSYLKADSVISALPFTVFPPELTQRIIRQAHSVLPEGRPFVQIHYSLKTKKVYQEIFGNVKIQFEPRNIPPAFIMTSIK